MSVTLLSWNVNGLRAAERKGFLQFLAQGKADVLCLQEIKAHEESLLSESLRVPPDYNVCFSLATERKGYSGVAVYSKIKPKSIKTNFGKNHLSTEGRMIELEFEKFTLLNIYFPNGGGEDHRLTYKLEFFDEFTAYVKKLVKSGKKVIFCGDVNVAHHAIDLARPEANKKSIGFLPEERAKLDMFEKAGFIDTFRSQHPETVAYSWWDQKTFSRDRNVGWRIDYFWVSVDLEKKVKEAFILGEVMGSDHAPVGIKLDL